MKTVLVPFAAFVLTGCSEQSVGQYNTPPGVSILSPAEGSDYDEDEMIELVGLVSDDRSDPTELLVRWVSDEEGVLAEVTPDAQGNVSFAVAELEIGGHAIILQAVDTDGEQGQDSVLIDIDEIQYRDPEPEDEEEEEEVDQEDGEPSAAIATPLSNDVFSEEDDIRLEGMVLDGETDLHDLFVRWASDVDGTLHSGTADSEGYSALSTPLSVGTHVITLTVQDGAGQEASDTVLVEVLDASDHDGDGDGWAESDGDCDDDDLSVSPGATEQCDTIDNDCDGDHNEDWRDEAEPNDDEAVDLGTVDGTLWFGSGMELEGLTLHTEDDVDFYAWNAGDDLWDDADISVEVTGLPSDGDHWLGLYLWEDEEWVLQVSDEGAEELSVATGGGFFGWDWDTGEDYWMVAVTVDEWSNSSCTTEYTLRISS